MEDIYRVEKNLVLNEGGVVIATCINESIAEKIVRALVCAYNIEEPKKIRKNAKVSNTQIFG